jgi:hypothetical protein
MVRIFIIISVYDISFSCYKNDFNFAIAHALQALPTYSWGDLP